MELELHKIKNCKTLFLDRDGVINQRIIDGYVTKPSEFIFIDGVLEAMKIFSSFFDDIFLVTNQQGIGKGLMTIDDLTSVHNYMLDTIKQHGGRFTELFYCPNLDKEKHIDRKPNIGMGLKAKEKYPHIDFHRSVMVGDSISDITFGKNLEMMTVYIGNPEDNANSDLCFNSLYDFAKHITL